MKYKIFLTFDLTYNTEKRYYIDYLDLYHKIESDYHTSGVYSYLLDNTYELINDSELSNYVIRVIKNKTLRYEI